MALLTIADIVGAANASGNSHRWFSPANRRFHGSCLSSTVYPLPNGGALFVESTRRFDGSRGYSVMTATPDGEIAVVGEFRQYSTLRRAQAAAMRHQAAARTVWDRDHATQVADTATAILSA